MRLKFNEYYFYHPKSRGFYVDDDYFSEEGLLIIEKLKDDTFAVGILNNDNLESVDDDKDFENFKIFDTLNDAIFYFNLLK